MEIILGKNEWEAANASGSHRHAYIREQYANIDVSRLRLISTTPGKRCLTFSDSYDVFGDGTFVMVDLPGHTNGLMGLVLTMPSGRRFLLGGGTLSISLKILNQ
ncbi:MAG: hypothetical protein A2277_06975 [Desulfobacterales bacterium RIFOXYA12_FULL_46_15]|nr:MAG: hypothetical protein A2277_06975 [Desulfobacterales bacterium RIFOXYA12_FULL_46_15]